tara:strand:+ start:2310 stop:2540 length:231 start_codon:yes stop_codon:yes gene_type:complete
MIKGNKKQEAIKFNIKNEIEEYENKIIQLKNQINSINKKIIQECVESHSCHNFREENEDGPYPETFCICINCGYEP